VTVEILKFRHTLQVTGGQMIDIWLKHANKPYYLSNISSNKGYHLITLLLNFRLLQSLSGD